MSTICDLLSAIMLTEDSELFHAFVAHRQGYGCPSFREKINSAGIHLADYVHFEMILVNDGGFSPTTFPCSRC